MKRPTSNIRIGLIAGLMLVGAVVGWRVVVARQRAEAHLAELTEKNRRLTAELRAYPNNQRKSEVMMAHVR